MNSHIVFLNASDCVSTAKMNERKLSFGRNKPVRKNKLSFIIVYYNLFTEPI